MHVCDSSSLISIWRNFRRQAISALRREAKRGNLKLPEGIVREMKKGKDALAKFAGDYEKEVIVYIKRNPNLQKEFQRIEMAYGKEVVIGKQKFKGFWVTPSGKRGADGQVVAVSKVQGAVAVSDDEAVKRVCLLENVECIGWTEFTRRLGLVKQLKLFTR
jgi:hypothetical protein